MGNVTVLIEKRQMLIELEEIFEFQKIIQETQYKLR